MEPGDIQTLADYSKLPYLTKQNIKDNLSELIAINFPKNTLVENYTGGSTGVPLRFIQDKNYLEIMRAIWLRGNSWAGWELGIKNAWLWGAVQDIAQGINVKGNIVNFINNRVVLNANDISELLMKGWYERLSKFKPKIIYGYSSAILIFAKYLLKYNYRLPPLYGIITTADTLKDRELIEKAFNCKLHNQYGCREIIHIASECRFGNMHVDDDTVLVEYLKYANGADQFELIVTPLESFGMPLLRYKIEDIAAPSNLKCDCGLPFSIMKFTEGRISDCLFDTSGNIVTSGPVITRLAKVFPEIDQFQIIQKKFGEIIVNLKVNEGWNMDFENRFLDELRSFFGINIKIVIKYVDRFIPNKSGKHRPMINEIKS